ncbi:MAG: hypothetical protein ACREVS_08905 [Burkholderiales bacterium]
MRDAPAPREDCERDHPSMTKNAKSLPAPAVARIESRIVLVRGQKVMLDADLAELPGRDENVESGGQAKPRPLP